jgi:hypothetical protein
MSKLIAAYGGGFKPPTKGHFEVVEKALNDFPEIDEFIIYVGGGERDGINQTQSILIWEIYQTYLPMKVKIEPSKAPIGDIIRLGKNNLQDEVYFVIGARDGFEDDMKDIESRTKNIEEKYPNMKIKVVTTPDKGMSGTNARQAAKVSYEDFIKFIPNELSDSEKEEVYNIVKPSIKEGLNENASYGKDIDVKGKIMQLTQHMLDKGYNIEPLPTVKFVDGDIDNARDFLGKTAYYNPENQTITLFTEGRHPKDIVRSFSHEMIHHIQYLEDRLGDITTTNTQEDDNLNNIEAEANLKGTMTFRNWTDSLNEAVTTQKTEKKKINISFELFDGTKVDEDIILAFSPDSTGVFTLGDNIEKYTGLSKKEAEEYNETTTDAYIYGLVNTMNDGQDIFFFNNGTRLKGQASKLGASVAVIEQIAHEGLHLTRLIIAKTLMGDKFPTGEWPSVGEQDNDSIEEEQLTTALSYVLNQITTPFLEMASNYIPKLSLNEAIVDDKIECDNCDWSWNIVDGGDDLFICHKCGHDNNNEQMEKNKDLFGLNQFAIDFANEIAEGIVKEGRYDKSTNQFSKIVFEFFKDVHDRGDKTGEFEFSVGPFEEDIYSEQFEFDLAGVVEITDDEYSVDGGANAGFDNKGDEITPLLSVKFKIPKNPDWQRVSFDIKDVVRHELEHLTQDGLNVKGGVVSDDPKLARPSKQMADDQLFRDMIDMDLLPKSDYFKLEKEVDAMLQGLYFKAKKSKRPFKDVIDDYLATQPINTEEKEEILNVWRSRGKALSLPLFEQNKMVMNYEIYSDMDGVLTDFDASFMKASDGILPSEYEKNFGKDGFWELIDGKGVGFWVGMPWMSDGKTYWDYIKGYNPILLSSPSRSNTSRLGKRLWVKNNLPGTKLILAQAKDKQNYAQSDRILIDDRPSNIDQWRASGGIGILHISASDTIRQLKDLGI